MAALRELHNVRQIPGEHRRRWFGSKTLDLIVWLDEGGTPIGFQLCYGKGDREHALTFEVGVGFSHAAVDDGETRNGSYKRTPVLLSAGHLEPHRLGGLFDEAKGELPAEISAFVSAALAEGAGR